MNLSAKMIDRRTSTPKGNHSYGPFFLEYSLLAEYNLLQKQKMPGVYVIPSYTSPLCKYMVSDLVADLGWIDLVHCLFKPLLLFPPGLLG